jgi:hypothetical protein
MNSRHRTLILLDSSGVEVERVPDTDAYDRSVYLVIKEHAYTLVEERPPDVRVFKRLPSGTQSTGQSNNLEQNRTRLAEAITRLQEIQTNLTSADRLFVDIRQGRVDLTPGPGTRTFEPNNSWSVMVTLNGGAQSTKG